MSRPLVSVIVGVYNKERFVGECLRSVLAQTYSPFELIVVDDGSTDGSAAEIAKVLPDDRVRSVRRPSNSGHPGVARNQAIRMAQGAYLAFLDADDLWLPEKLARQVAYMEAHPEYPFTHTRCMVVDGAGVESHLRHGGNYPPPGDCLDPLMRHCFICTSSVMVRREVVGAVGAFSEAPEFKSGQDYEFFLRCAKAYPVGMPDGVWVRYRCVSGTVSRQSGNWRSIPRDFVRHRIFLRRRDLWEGRMEETAVRKIAYGAAEENAFFRRRNGEFGKAAWFAGQMVRMDPWAAPGWRQLAAAVLRRRA